jgi:hypothetical protein
MGCRERRLPWASWPGHGFRSCHHIYSYRWFDSMADLRSSDPLPLRTQVTVGSTYCKSVGMFTSTWCFHALACAVSGGFSWAWRGGRARAVLGGAVPGERASGPWGAALGFAQMQSFLLTLRCASSSTPCTVWISGSGPVGESWPVTGTPRDARVRGAVQCSAAQASIRWARRQLASSRTSGPFWGAWSCRLHDGIVSIYRRAACSSARRIVWRWMATRSSVAGRWLHCTCTRPAAPTDEATTSTSIHPSVRTCTL